MNKEQFLQQLRESWFDPSIVDIGAIDKNLVPHMNLDVVSDFNNNQMPDKPIDITRFYLILNSLNHRFWSHNEDGSFVRYSHNGEVGANALSAGMLAIYRDSISMDNFQHMDADIFRKYFGNMPDLAERVTIMNQAITASKACAEILLDSKDQGWSILEAMTIADSMPLGYKDDALKKAQLALHMISSALLSKGIKIETSLTCFADYQVPKVLRHMGILNYSPELAEKIDSGQIIEKDSREEHAIRAATIIACEELSKQTGIPTPMLDYWLWTKRNESPKPFHLTYTNAY